MTDKTIKLQLPMDKSLRDALSKRSDALGFDSVQAFLRFLAKAQVDGRIVSFGYEEWPDASPAVASRLHEQAKHDKQLQTEGRGMTHQTADSLMKGLLSDEVD